jgi:hypothetical protein
VVFVATSELQPLPKYVVQATPGSGSLLKTKLSSDAVTVPVEPVSKVLMTLAEASETESKQPTIAIPKLNLPIVKNFAHKLMIHPPNSLTCSYGTKGIMAGVGMWV